MLSRAENSVDNLIIFFFLMLGVLNSYRLPRYALTKIEFDQYQFIDRTNAKRTDEQALLDPDGICVGFQMVSYIYEALGLEKELVESLQDIQNSDKALSSRQKLLVELLDEGQEENYHFTQTKQLAFDQHITIKKVKEIIGMELSKANAYADLREIVEDCIHRSMVNFGSKILMDMSNGAEYSHVVGFMAKLCGTKLVVQFDDSDTFINMQFDNAAHAQFDITNLLFFKYYPNFSVAWLKGENPTVRILGYDLEINDEPSIKPELKLWAEANRHFFFATPGVSSTLGEPKIPGGFKALCESRASGEPKIPKESKALEPPKSIVLPSVVNPTRKRPFN